MAAVDDVVLCSLEVDAVNRPPAWRWQLARRLVDDDRGPSRAEAENDPWLLRAYRMAKRVCGKGRLKQDWDLRSWTRYASDRALVSVYRAWALYEDKASIGFKEEIEAWLLTRESPEWLAVRIRIPLATLTAYEAVFFHVKDRLDYRGWVVQSVLGPSYHNNLTERQYAVLWKMYAYMGGKNVLNLFVDKSALTANTPADGAVGGVRGDQRQMITLKAATAIRTLRLDSFSQMPLLELERDLQAAELALGRGHQEEGVGLLSALLDSVTYQVSQSGQVFRAEPRAMPVPALPAAPPGAAPFVWPESPYEDAEHEKGIAPRQ